VVCSGIPRISVVTAELNSQIQISSALCSSNEP